MQNNLSSSASSVNNSGSVLGLAAEGGLDLIFGHLRTSSLRPVFRHVEEQPKNWFCTDSHEVKEQGNFVAKVQRFEAGGYEVLCRRVDLPALARMVDAPRRTGERKPSGESDPELIARSIQRSKTKVRYLIKSLGADRLFTLTRRESDPDRFWSLQDWADAWKAFCRSAKRAGVDLHYVAIPEHHKKGNFHLHVALRGRINIKLARSIWWSICGGRGQGNVDVKFRKDLPVTRRLAGLSKYLSKYLTKQFGNDRFNKKRYWASRHALPPVERIVLTADDAVSALAELAEMFALDVGELLRSKQGAFLFPDRYNPSGFWLNYSDELCSPCPF